jgi:diguanylate cyclase (GGDEF)-like protein/PAS domain S-box-containing protein
VERPGELCSAHLRIFLDDHWGHHEIHWLNLLDDPDVGVNLCVEYEVPGPAFPAPDGIDPTGHHNEANWVLLDVDASGQITDVTGQPSGTLGYEPGELIGRSTTDFLHPDSVGAAALNWLALKDDPTAARPTLRRWLRRDGTDVVLETSYLNPGEADDGGMRLILHDVADRLRDEEALDRSRRELEDLADELGELGDDVALLADEVPLPVFRCDAQGSVRFHNSRWAEVVPATVTHLHELIDASGAEPLADALVTALAGTDTVVEVPAADGTRVLRLHLQRTLGAADGGTAPFPPVDDIVGAVEDVTATVELRQRAEHDPLTGLASRALTEQRLAHALAADPDGTVVVYIDLDGFKAVNDVHGHAAGDTVLHAVARRLAAAVRPADLVGRLGGDEFVVVCRGVDRSPTAVDAIVNHLEHALAGPVALTATSWEPRASFGTARPRRGEGPTSVLRRADAAMFASKHAKGAAR